MEEHADMGKLMGTFLQLVSTPKNKISSYLPHVNFCIAPHFNVATGWTVRGQNPGRGEIFPTHPASGITGTISLSRG